MNTRSEDYAGTPHTLPTPCGLCFLSFIRSLSQTLALGHVAFWLIYSVPHLGDLRVGTCTFMFFKAFICEKGQSLKEIMLMLVIKSLM